MVSTHLVFTARSCGRVAIPKLKAVVAEHEGKVKVWSIDYDCEDETYWIAKETFDELLKQLED